MHYYKKQATAKTLTQCIMVPEVEVPISLRCICVQKINKVVKTYKRFQSQGHVKRNLTEHACIVSEGRLPSAGQAATVSQTQSYLPSFSF